MASNEIRKIEVIIDKINLIMESRDGQGQLNPLELKLLRKYAQDLKSGVENILPSESPQSFVQETPEKTAPAKISPEPPEEKPEIKKPTTKRIEPIKFSENDEMEENINPDPDKSQSIAFDDQGIVTQSTGIKPNGKEDGVYQEISDNLEAIKKNKENYLKKQSETGSGDPDDESLSINERFKREEGDLVDQLKTKPIENLNNEIDLNDKFWFIQELFDGKSTPFNELISELDQLRTWDDAKDKINKYSADWDQNSRVAKKFMNVVRRRYL